MVSVALSLVVSLASYYFYCAEPWIVDAAFLYRGWPLYWVIESWGYWGPPPYSHTFNLNAVNFLTDFAFWAFVFQVPMQCCCYLAKAKKQRVQ
jgi:hypothetical protein